VNDGRVFRLFKNGREVRLVVVSDQHWKVLCASSETGFEEGDEVTSAERMSWQKAKRRVNSCRSALSPNRLVLLRGKGLKRSDGEVLEILRHRPWDPDPAPAA